jgi:DNA-binding MarR family transcriptional regulator
MAKVFLVNPEDSAEVPARLRAVIGRLGRRLRQTRAGADLSPSQYEVLATIVKRGPLRLSEVAAAEGLNPTMLSRILAVLEESDLVGRTQDPDDGRVVHLAATKTGRDLITRIRRERTDALSVVLDELSDVDRETLSGALPVLESLAEILRDRPL